MTRFARAKGSKASNERFPNEATPWCVMKQQWADNSAMKNNRPEKTKSAKELLSAKNDLFYSDTTGDVNTDWAEFEPCGTSKQDAKGKKRSNNNKASEKLTRQLDNTPAGNGNSSMLNSNNRSESPKKSKKQKFTVQHEESEKGTKKVDCAPAENGNNSNSNGNSISPKKSKKQKLISQHTESAAECIMKNEPNAEAAQVIKQKSAKKAKKRIDSLDSPVVENTMNVGSACEMDGEPMKKKKKKNKKVNISADTVTENPINVKSAHDTDCEPAKKKKKQRDKKMENPPTEIGATTTETLDVKQENPEKKSLIVSKRHKRNQKRIEKNALMAATATGGKKMPGETSSGGFDAAGNDWSSNVNFGKRQNFETENAENKDASGTNDFKRPRINQNEAANNATKRKAPKIRDDKEHKRRKPANDNMKCVINGMELEIVMYDGFYVKKEDADRLKDLRKQMVMKGIPKSEIDGAMKLERRRAEKALARVRRQVCFHCRKAGHNLSECPEVGEGESATGICFKCGSTEHTHFECKVAKKEEFRFASCFICREQGHIAKQCPDNPKGLYPHGGSCKICGDVTHLRKDCPELTQEKEESTLTLSTITGNTLESLDEDVTKKAPAEDSKKAKGKIVKF